MVEAPAPARLARVLYSKHLVRGFLLRACKGRRHDLAVAVDSFS
jgi:hypothetical protein